MVIVDFQGTVSGPGKPTHIDLKIDNGQYKPVTSPHTTSSGLAERVCVDGAILMRYTSER
jgi:hypothetical protein